jgi:hypothetical protein
MENVIVLLACLMWFGSWMVTFYYWSKTKYFKEYDLDGKFISFFLCAHTPFWSLLYKLKQWKE